jgi:hypothetical protein
LGYPGRRRQRLLGFARAPADVVLHGTNASVILRATIQIMTHPERPDRRKTSAWGAHEPAQFVISAAFKRESIILSGPPTPGCPLKDRGHDGSEREVHGQGGPRQSRCVCGWLILIVALSCLARAVFAEEPPPAESADGPSSHADILNAMQDVRRKYGSDAVMLEGHLLGQAVRSGAVGETTVSVGGFEERGGKRFLTFKVDTGIIFNDRDIGAASRPGRLWKDVAEASLRKFRSLTVPADGIALTLSYAHRESLDEADLRGRRHEEPGKSEAVVFYLLLPDVGDLVADRITGEQLIERSKVLLNGAPARVLLGAPTPTAGETTH